MKIKIVYKNTEEKFKVCNIRKLQRLFEYDAINKWMNVFYKNVIVGRYLPVKDGIFETFLYNNGIEKNEDVINKLTEDEFDKITCFFHYIELPSYITAKEVAKYPYIVIESLC